MRFLSILFFTITFVCPAQESNRFLGEVEAIHKKYDSLWDASKETIVFTGSSSVRIWKDLEQRFPAHQIVNSGFGGSQASDLLFYIEELILRYQPKSVFIYEGDNDIATRKKPKKIIETTLEIISKIRAENQNTKIVLIAAKPSIARWNLKRRYQRLNRKFKRIGNNDPQIFYADVWRPMLDKRRVKQDIFIEDGLHMNAKGYEIWYTALKEFVD
ncbi:MAG: GDSL-type esterase/lipase family protein [Flavobacteriaceae bacterium]